jgi:hypothetical protein
MERKKSEEEEDEGEGRRRLRPRLRRRLAERANNASFRTPPPTPVSSPHSPRPHSMLPFLFFSSLLLLVSTQCTETTCSGPFSVCFSNDATGSAECMCDSTSYVLGPDGRTCVDVDECRSRKRQEGATGVCSDDALCVNSDGGYSCVCTQGGSYSYTENRCLGGDGGGGSTDGGGGGDVGTPSPSVSTDTTVPPGTPVEEDDSNLVLILVVSGSLLLVACSIAGACCCAVGVHFKFRRPSYPHHRGGSSRGPSRSRSRAGSRPTPLASTATRRRRLASGQAADDLSSSGNRSGEASAARRSGVLAAKTSTPMPRFYADLPQPGGGGGATAALPRSAAVGVPKVRSLVAPGSPTTLSSSPIRVSSSGRRGVAGTPHHHHHTLHSPPSSPTASSSSTSRFITARATGERRAQSPAELTVRVGDTLTLLDAAAPPASALQSRGAWLRGGCDGRTGIFPLSLIAYTPEIGARFNVSPPPPAHEEGGSSGYSADHFTGGPPPPTLPPPGHYSALQTIPSPPARSRPLPASPTMTMRPAAAASPTYTYGTVPPEPGTQHPF